MKDYDQLFVFLISCFAGKDIESIDLKNEIMKYKRKVSREVYEIVLTLAEQFYVDLRTNSGKFELLCSKTKMNFTGVNDAYYWFGELKEILEWHMDLPQVIYLGDLGSKLVEINTETNKYCSKYFSNEELKNIKCWQGNYHFDKNNDVVILFRTLRGSRLLINEDIYSINKSKRGLFKLKKGILKNNFYFYWDNEEVYHLEYDIPEPDPNPFGVSIEEDFFVWLTEFYYSEISIVEEE